MKLKIKRFDMSSIPDDKIIVMVGARGNGKSWLVQDLLYYHQDLPIGVVVSATEGMNKFYSSMVPKQFIHEECTPDIIEKVITRQKKIIKKMHKETAITGRPSNIDPRAFLILDDCLFDDKWTRDKNMRYIFMNGRHLRLIFIMTSQYALGIPPNLRTNIDYTFVLRENNIANRRRLYENYAGFFPSFECFCTVMDQCTENYECLVIHNNAKSNKLEDQVFWYKADPHEDYRIGADVFWEMQHQADDEDSDGDEPFNPATYTHKKSKGPRLNVKKHY